jgi:hypothetical protein
MRSCEPPLHLRATVTVTTGRRKSGSREQAPFIAHLPKALHTRH